MRTFVFRSRDATEWEGKLCAAAASLSTPSKTGQKVPAVKRIFNLRPAAHWACPLAAGHVLGKGSVAFTR